MGYSLKKQPTLFEKEAALLSSMQASFTAKCKRSARLKGIAESEAEDLAQNAFCKVLEAIKHRGVAENHNLVALLNTAHQRIEINHLKGLKPTVSVVLRKDGTEKDLLDDIASPNVHPLQALMLAEMFAVIDEVVETRHEEAQNTWQRYAEGDKYMEISEALTVKSGTVGSHIKNIKDRVLPIFKEREMSNIFNLHERGIGKGEQDEGDDE